MLKMIICAGWEFILKGKRACEDEHDNNGPTHCHLNNTKSSKIVTPRKGTGKKE